MEIFTNILNALSPYLFAIIMAFIAWLLGRRGNNADISDKLGQASDALSALYEKRIKALEDELEPLRPLPEKVQFLRDGIDVLLKQMKQSGIIPAWTPDTGVTVALHRKNGR